MDLWNRSVYRTPDQNYAELDEVSAQEIELRQGNQYIPPCGHHDSDHPQRFCCRFQRSVDDEMGSKKHLSWIQLREARPRL